MLAPYMLYRCIPQRFRFLARWFAMIFFLVAFALVVVLFAKTLMTMKRNHGHWLLHPRSHQPLSPDFIRYKQPDWRSREES